MSFPLGILTALQYANPGLITNRLALHKENGVGPAVHTIMYQSIICWLIIDALSLYYYDSNPFYPYGTFCVEKLICRSISTTYLVTSCNTPY